MGALHLSRRRVLACAAVGAGGLSGCVGELETTSDGAESTSAGGRVPPGEDRLDAANEDVEVEVLRDEETDDTILPTFGTYGEGHEQKLLVSEAEAADLEFERVPDGIERIRSFVEETDFERQSAAITQLRTEACYHTRLQYVETRPDQFRTSFCNVLRAPDVRCEAGRELLQLTAVRFPSSYEEETKPTSQESSWSRRCPPVPPVEEGVR